MARISLELYEFACQIIHLFDHFSYFVEDNRIAKWRGKLSVVAGAGEREREETQFSTLFRRRPSCVVVTVNDCEWSNGSDRNIRENQQEEP